MVDQKQDWPFNKVEYIDKLEASLKTPRHFGSMGLQAALLDESTSCDPYPQYGRKAKHHLGVLGLSQDMSSSKLHLLAASDMKVRPDGLLDLSPSNYDVRASQELPSNLRLGTQDKSMKMSLPMKRDMSEFGHKNESKTSRN